MNCFLEMQVIKKDDGFYRLILPFRHMIDPSYLKALSLKKQRREIIESIEYEIGFVTQSCKLSGIMVDEIEIIMPPFSEYLNVSEELRDNYTERNIKLSVSIGRTVNLDVDLEVDKQGKNFVKKLKKHLDAIKKQGSELN